MATAHPYTIYFGGELFSGKHLMGNGALAEAIYERSNGRYAPVLPQNLEQRETTAHAIRDQDIRALLACDLALFNYDGPELDSGTVVEFMFAKFADIPSVLLRTDFRNGGDQEGRGEPWNLMTSFYPRTRSVILNAMELYQRGLHRDPAGDALSGLQTSLEGKKSMLAAEGMTGLTAAAVIREFDALLEQPAVLLPEMRETVYRWLALMPGFKALGSDEAVAEMLKRCVDKTDKGLL